MDKKWITEENKNANNFLKYLTSLIIKEIQINTKYYLSLLYWQKNKKQKTSEDIGTLKDSS